MPWRGRLIIDGTSGLANPQPPTVPNPVRLAIAGGRPTPLVAATNVLVNNRFVNNEPVIVAGQSGQIGTLPVIFMTGVQHAAEVEGVPAIAGSSGAGKKWTAKKKSDAKKAATKPSARPAVAKANRERGAPGRSAGKPSGKRGAKKTAKPTSKKAAKRRAKKGERKPNET